jgi:predicted nucleotidyltransferase
MQAICGLFQFAGFELALEEALNPPVDVMTSGGLFEDVRDTAEREGMIVYEAQ